MIPAPFEYRRVEFVDHAIQILADEPDAKIIAGGHSLLPLMRLRLARPSMLVDISRLKDLSYIREQGDRIAIGALTRHHDLAASELLQELCPIVSYTAGEIGDPQVRHVGTIGGSIAHADPASDLPTVMMALEAEFEIRGPNGLIRHVPAADFFRGLFEPDLGTSDVLTEIRVPKTAGRGWSYLKFHRRQQDWALVGVAALAAGSDPSTASSRAAEGTSPPSDAFASAEYRQELVKVLVRRALEEAQGR